MNYDDKKKKSKSKLDVFKEKFTGMSVEDLDKNKKKKKEAFAKLKNMFTLGK